MRRRALSTVALVLLVGLAISGSRAEDGSGPTFGEALYFAYQGKWFDALEQLNAASVGGDRIEKPERDSLWYRAADANFSVGDFELNYRMHHRAARIMQTALKQSPDSRFYNDAAYRLARLYFRKGQEHDALRALDRISGEVRDEIRDDVAFLRAGIYLALEWSEPAIPVLQKLLKSKEYGAFAAYNLGIAYLQGDLKQSAYEQLDRAGRIKAKTASDLAIRDKANLVLGTLLHEEGQFNRAIVYLSRVRLDGPFSNRALLSAGWANMSSGRPKRAIVSWGALAERDATDRATQEAMLALPYAYGQMGLHEQAAGHYSRALDAYAGQLDRLVQSINSIRKGRFLDVLVRDEIREDEDWLIELRSLPDTPETYYLMELLASHDFQTGLKNYLDLADLRRRLLSWSASFNAYDELIANREEHYESLLPEIDAQFGELDARLRRRVEQYARLVEQRTSIEIRPELQTADQSHVAELDRKLQSLHDALNLAQTHYDQFLLAREAAADSYVGYDKPLESLTSRTDAAIGNIESLMMRQGQMLEKLASDELTQRLRGLEVYASKARYGLADSKDRITRQAQQ